MDGKEYDFLIVGGGTSGLVVASRLSENVNTQVLVLEAGENHNHDPRVKIPALYQALKYTDLDWSFSTESQAALNGRRISLSQGRALGGSSAINAHVFVPPSDTVIDAWEKLGNPGWNWRTLKPYYTKAYTLNQPQSEVIETLGVDWVKSRDTETSGPIQTSYTNNTEDPIPKAWLNTLQTLGFQMSGDPFSGKPMGAFSPLSSIDPTTRERSHAGTAYYGLIADRPNVHVLTGSRVEKIIFDKKEGKLRASGVLFQRKGVIYSAKARLEVILACGSIQSPQVLELSGIGHASLLSSHGVNVLIDNPHVGENLQDHVVCCIGFEAEDNVRTLDDLVRQDLKAIEAAMREYATTQTGPFASVGIASYAYLPVVEFLSEEGRRTFQTLFNKIINMTAPGNSATELNLEISKSILKNEDDASGAYLAVPAQRFDPADPASEQPPAVPVDGNFITLGVMLSLPLSRGSVHITSRDSRDKPAIDPQYLSHPLDMEVLARHVRYLEVIAASDPFRSLLKEHGRRVESDSHLNDLDMAKAFLRTYAFSMWHPTSTCSMMPRDKGGVVDGNLRVYGTENVRVVDASVFPLIPRANCQSTVYAVAERASDLIKVNNGLLSA